MIDLSDKRALVPGGPARAGAAIARRLAREGARVWINAVEELEEARALAHEIGGEAIEADVADAVFASGDAYYVTGAVWPVDGEGANPISVVTATA